MKLINKNFCLFETIVGIISLGIVPFLYIIFNQIYRIDIYIVPTITTHLIAGIATWRTSKNDTFGDLLMWQSIYLSILVITLFAILNILVRDGLFLSFSVFIGILILMCFIPFAVLYCAIYTLITKHRKP